MGGRRRGVRYQLGIVLGVVDFECVFVGDVGGDGVDGVGIIEGLVQLLIEGIVLVIVLIGFLELYELELGNGLQLGYQLLVLLSVIVIVQGIIDSKVYKIFQVEGLFWKNLF